MDFEDQICTVPRGERRVFYLESAEGIETQERVRRGYDPQNLYAVTHNPATLAICTRRLASMGISRYNRRASDAIQAAEEWKDAGVRFHVVNLDMCGGATVKTLSTVSQFPRASMVHNAVMSVTVLMGRETPSTLDRWQTISDDRHNNYHEIVSFFREFYSKKYFGKLGPDELERLRLLKKKIRRELRIDNLIENELGKLAGDFDCYRITALMTRMLGLNSKAIFERGRPEWIPRPKVGRYRSGTQTMLWISMRIPKFN